MNNSAPTRRSTERAGGKPGCSRPAPQAPASRPRFTVGIADMAASSNPNTEIVSYSLGSCLGITMYDPVARAGGLLHVLLPSSTIHPAKAALHPFMFLDTGLPRLLKAVLALGATSPRLQIKAAGGAQFLRDEALFNIGHRNISALTEWIAASGLRVLRQDVGGHSSRTVRLDLSSGDLWIHKPGSDPYVI